MLTAGADTRSFFQALEYYSKEFPRPGKRRTFRRMPKKRILCVVGTRPEAIKMAPVILELQRRAESFETTVMATAQHREMLDDVMKVFAIRPDIDLNIMTRDQRLSDVTSKVLLEITRYIREKNPDAVLAQGDTTTVMATAMACFYEHARFGHVEAGLRTGDLTAPFPEEFNRRVAALATHFHFAPTDLGRQNLLKEGIPDASIHVTGNTVVDALKHILKHTSEPARPVPAGSRYVLMTCHRRESFGEKVRGVFESVRAFAQKHPDLHIWYPVHPNPNVKGPAGEILGGLKNVMLTEPVDYITFLHAIRHCFFLLTDSGGIQEEATSMGKPALVLRDMTERPEGVLAGACELVGTDRDRISSAMERLVTDEEHYRRMSVSRDVFGDGRASDRIAQTLACPCPTKYL
jgi:UDP-N-acetylglucosamine 2-epimerase (non-hydrolysing)